MQLAPCLSPRHPSTIEENQQARLEILQKTQELGTIVGSGEGFCPTWSLPGLDFFEGLMSLRTYVDSHLKIPSGGYETDLGESYRRDAAITLDETRRIPLYQLAFHDYVGSTWVWRDTNFQSRPYAWKKDLFNILYGTMPMWHINRKMWESHKADYIASYRAIASVRSKIGFASMTGHGWLTTDRSVQYSDWETGDRVIVNFGNQPFQRTGKPDRRRPVFPSRQNSVRSNSVAQESVFCSRLDDPGSGEIRQRRPAAGGLQLWDNCQREIVAVPAFVIGLEGVATDRYCRSVDQIAEGACYRRGSGVADHGEGGAGREHIVSKIIEKD